MTTGNSAAMTVSVAKMAPPDISQSKCEELDKKNKQERRKAISGMEGSESESAALSDALSKAEGGGMTFSSASISVRIGGGKGISGVASGCSNAKAKECTSGSLVEGGTSEMKSGDQKVLCPEAGYKHAAGGSGAHAEAKIINQMTEMANKANGSLQRGSVLLNVDWRYKQPDGNVYESGMPCKACYRMMCAAKKCGIEIFLCDANNEPQPLDPDGNCDKKSKDPSKSSYKDLDQRMKEHRYKGVRRVS